MYFYSRLSLCFLVFCHWVWAYVPTMRGWIHRPVLQSVRRMPLQVASNPNIFDDDLFGDGDEAVKKKKVTGAESIKSSARYLDEDWKLSPEDQKEFKGFGAKKGSDSDAVAVTDVMEPTMETPETVFPCYALMYRLRKEYIDQPIDSTVDQHNEYCKRFKRLINSEVIALKKRKGVVLLWAGLTEDDRDETRAEIKEFLVGDPLIEKDMVEKWEIIDMEEKQEQARKGTGRTDAVSKSVGGEQ